MNPTSAPWLSQYPDGDRASFEPAHDSVLAVWRSASARHRDRVFVRYFGTELTFGEVDALTDALAAGWAHAGIGPGAAVALFLQNTPAFVLSAIAAWKLGGIVVPVNPMSRVKELDYVVGDCAPAVLVTHPALFENVVEPVMRDDPAKRMSVFVSREDDLAAKGLPDVFAPSGLSSTPAGPAPTDLMEFIGRWRDSPPPPPPSAPGSGTQPAVLTYTSGTTGNPKGAINTHGNIAYNAESCWRWIGLDSDDSVLAVAPLFHITGFIIHLVLAMFGAVPLVLTYRFDAPTMLDIVDETKPTFAIGSITAFIALLSAARSDQRGAAKLSSLTKVCSGGAPVPPSVVVEYEREVGPYILNMYGLTETTSAVTGVPRGRRAPVDPASGALSVGVPMYGTSVTIVGDDGQPLPPNEIGELVIRGPQVVPGYWQKPEETAHALGGGELRTGDVGFMDEQGWVYLVDRKKDMIIASGYKVWPREVEDVLYSHPAVLEAAVVGLPDDYRGETVGAFVVLRAGQACAADELVDFCRQQMAAYKIPRQVRFLPELPKTTTGKILRRSLRGA